MSNLVSDALTYARNLAQTDSNGLTDPVGLTFANDGLQNITRSLFKKNINAGQTDYFYADFVAGQGQYAWPANMFALKTVELNFTDSLQQNYIQPQKMDVSNIQGGTSWDYLRVNQPAVNPVFTNYGDTFEVFPTPTANNAKGIQILAFVTPTEFSAVSSSIPYPLSLDFRCLGARIASLYCASLEKFSLADKWDIEYKERLHDIIEILAPQSEQPIQASPLNISGWQY